MKDSRHIPFSLLLGALSGGLAYLAFPPVDAGWVAFVALVPLVLIFRRGKQGEVAAASAAFAIVFFGLLISWMRLVTLPGYIALVLLQAFWIVAVLQIGCAARKSAPGPLWVAVFPVAFLASEYLRAHFPFGGFGWGGFGYTQHNNLAMLRLAGFTGVWGLSLLVITVNAFVAEAAKGFLKPEGGLGKLRWSARVHLRGAAGWASAALALPLVCGLLPPVEPLKGRSAKIAMVQGNAPEGTYDPNADDLTVLRSHIRLTRRLPPGPKPALVVWPEGAFDRDPYADPQLEGPLKAIIRDTAAPFLVGALVEAKAGSGAVRNSSLLFRPNATQAGVYAKQNLVPYGETVPGRRFLEPLVRGISRIPVDLTAGTESTVFTLPQGRFASAICYESTYPDLVRNFVRNGARLLVVSTNDSSFGRTSASLQHLAFSQLRAAENRMWVAHTALSGVSAVVAPTGRVTKRTGLFVPDLVVANIRFATKTTSYATFGDWVAYACLTALAALGLLAATRRTGNRKAKRAVTEAPPS
ncbi:MAG: apolipoprotein N-acyltransferase [Actinomycetota bacterium]